MGDAEEYCRSETRRKILKALEEADEPLGPKDVAEITDLPENTVRQRLYQMSKVGEVKVEARGRYVPHNVHNNRNNEGADVTEVMDVMDARNDTPSPIYCIHGFPSGENCYVCDPNHPHRENGGAS